MNQNRPHPRGITAERVYTLILRLYPRAHRGAFGPQMLQTFGDSYRAARETEGASALQFWLGVIGDEGMSIAREHIAVLREGTSPMTGRDSHVNRIALTLTVLASTLILAAVTSLTPNAGRPSENLAVEVLPALIGAGVLSLVAGYVASRGTGSFRSGALGGAVNAVISLGFLLLVLSIADRHFRSIGGPSLFVGLPLVALVGALFGTLGACLDRLTRAARGPATLRH